MIDACVVLLTDRLTIRLLLLVCCSVLQGVAGCCRVLQCFVVCCSVVVCAVCIVYPQCGAVCIMCVAVRINAVCCSSVLQFV